MNQLKRAPHAARVLRFTVSSALVMAPLVGCGPSRAINPGPEEVVQPNTSPPEVVLPSANPIAYPTPEVAIEVDAGVDAGDPNSGHSGANPGPHGHGSPAPTHIDDPVLPVHANPGLGDVPVES